MAELFSMDSSLCQYNFDADNSRGSLERTHQTTVGAILVDSHASVSVYFLLKITHVTYKKPNVREYHYDETNAPS